MVRVLYIDDDEALVFLMQRVLERLGYAVTGCCDAEQGLEEFRSRPNDFDAIVTDLGMPGMSGFELSEQLLAVRPNVTILVTSGFVRPEDEEKAQHLGLRGVILKPDTVDELGTELDRMFRSSPASGAAKP